MSEPVLPPLTINKKFPEAEPKEFANAPEPDFQQFYRTVTGKPTNGLADTNKYVFMIARPAGLETYTTVTGSIVNDLSFLCESSTLPPRGITLQDVRYYGPNVKFPFQTNYGDGFLSATFVCRDKFSERKFFDDWMNLVNPINKYDLAYKSEYVVPINVFQYAADFEAIYQFTFEKAFPVNVDPQEVRWGADDYHRIRVTFSYDRWFRNPNDIFNESY